MDCVGPLPKTKSGNQYLLTIMCASTRFPEATQLGNFGSKSVVTALVGFFTLVGLPKVVQFDQGTNFMSYVFQQVMLELGIQQLNSSAYHPGGDWDEGIHMLLFAISESVREHLVLALLN